jgi:hypothetical protein
MNTKKRHKHVLVDQEKLDRVRAQLGVRTESEAIDKALDEVDAEADVIDAIRSLKGKVRIVDVFGINNLAKQKRRRRA